MFVKSANLQTHMKSVHKKKLKPKHLEESSSGVSAKDGTSKGRRGSAVSFPWKWLGVGIVILILVLAVVVIKPSLPSNSSSNNNNNTAAECIEGKNIIARYTFTLHILITDDSKGLQNYTQPISYGIGKLPYLGQPCTRKMYTSDAEPYEYNVSSQAAIVHVESPTTSNTLGDFFKIWDQDLNYTQGVVMSYHRTAYTIVMKVNGQTQSGVWEHLALQNGMNIVFYLTKIS